MPRLKYRLLALTMLVACGDDNGSATDGSAIDANQNDAITIDAEVPPGTCGVSIIAPLVTTALEDIAVVFSSSSGDLLTSVMVDSGGSASYADCRAATMVTVLMLDSAFGARVALTYGGIEPGQTIIVGVPPVTLPPDPNSTLSVSLSAVSVPATATGFDMRTGRFCGDSGTVGVPLTAAIVPVCLGNTPATIDLLATAFDTAGDPVGYDFATDVAVVTNGTTSVGLDGWEAPGSLAITVTNVSLAASVIQLQTSQSRDGIIYFAGGGLGAAPTATATLAAGPALFRVWAVMTPASFPNRWAVSALMRPPSLRTASYWCSRRTGEPMQS